MTAATITSAFFAPSRMRRRALAAVVAAHLLLAWLILSLAGPLAVHGAPEGLRVFEIARTPPPPPPVDPPPTPVRAARRQVEGAPVPAAPAPPAPPRSAPVSTKQQTSAPAAPADLGPRPAAPAIIGGGSGAGAGAGTGSGDRGAGTSGSVPAQPPRLASGRIVPRDYPRGAAGAQGTVTVHLMVTANGLVSGCSVARSSGNAVLDSATCRLVRERFRYTPARDAQGAAVPALVGWQQNWWRD